MGIAKSFKKQKKIRIVGWIGAPMPYCGHLKKKDSMVNSIYKHTDTHTLDCIISRKIADVIPDKTDS